MKLFIWIDPYPVNYGGSALYVVADNVEQARRQAQAAADQWGQYRSVKLGEPTRILEPPCAEWYHWEE